MGNSVISITDEQRNQLTKVLRIHYDLLILEGLSEIEIQKSMTEKYDEMSTMFYTESKPVIVQPLNVKITPRKQYTKNQSLLTTSKSSNVVSTRRSMDQSSTVKSPGKIKQVKITKSRRMSYMSTATPIQTTGLKESTDDNISATTSLNTLEALAFDLKKPVLTSNVEVKSDTAVDKWESASLQPFCIICNMFFQSEVKRDRHLKFSEVHAINKKLLQPEPSALPDNSTTINITDVSQESDSGEDDNTDNDQSGVHGELIYSGTKFFWRSRMNIEMNIYQHIKANTIEIIPYDSFLHIELSRVYLSRPLLISMIGVDAIGKKVEEINAKLEIQGLEFNSSPLCLSAKTINEEAIELALSSYILPRLQLVTPPKATTDSVVFESFSLDQQSSTSPILLAPVKKLIPVTIIRRRRATISDIAATMESIAQAQSDLASATIEAERFSTTLSKTSINSLLQDFQQKK